MFEMIFDAASPIQFTGVDSSYNPDLCEMFDFTEYQAAIEEMYKEEDE